MFCQKRVHAEQTYPRIVDTPHETHPVLSRHWWLWHKICGQRTCQTLTHHSGFLNNIATNSKAMIKYHSSNMVLAVYSGTSYLNKPQAWSRAGGHLFYCISGRSQVGCAVHQLKPCSPSATNSTRNGSPTVPNTDTNRQFNSILHHHTQSNSFGCESHGHALPLVTWLQTKTAVFILLETGKNKLHRLLDQAPCCSTSQISLTLFLNTHCKITRQTNQGGGGAAKEQLLTGNQNTKIASRIWQLWGCAGIPKIPNPNSGQRPDRPRGKSRRSNHNHGKGTDDPKHKKQTDASIRKIQPAQVRTKLTKYHWQI